MRWDGGPGSVSRILPAVMLCLALGVVPGFAQEPPQQERPTNPRYPFLKPPPDPAPVAAAQPAPAAQPAGPPLPAYVTLPAGAILNVVLETPLSTRIAKTNQRVTFRTSSAVHFAEGFDLPPDTAIHGTVVEATKPGGFGRAGVIRVRIQELELPQNAIVPLEARLQSAETDKHGRIRADQGRGADMVALAQYGLTGVLLGSRIGGAKGAGIGAGAGLLAAILIEMSHRGQDVYLEPGMPFVVVLDRAVELPGQPVFEAQEAYARAHAPVSRAASGNDRSSTETSTDVSNGIPPNERPVLKRRPKRP